MWFGRDLAIVLDRSRLEDAAVRSSGNSMFYHVAGTFALATGPATRPACFRHRCAQSYRASPGVAEIPGGRRWILQEVGRKQQHNFTTGTKSQIKLTGAGDGGGRERGREDMNGWMRADDNISLGSVKLRKKLGVEYAATVVLVPLGALPVGSNNLCPRQKQAHQHLPANNSSSCH